MVRHNRMLTGLMSAALMLAIVWSPAFGADIPTVTKETLKPMLDDPDLVVLDVRAGRDWKSSEFKIKGAQRVDPGNLAAWSSQYAKNKKYVLYCA